MIFFLLRLLSFVVGHLPLFVVYPLGALLGRAAYLVDGSHRKRAQENLRRVFTEKSPADITALSKEVFKNLGITALEFLRIPYLNLSDLDGYVTHEGLEHIDRARESGKGIIFITAHFGNWELMAAASALRGYPLDVVARRQKGSSVEKFVEWVRSSPGNRVIDKRGSMRELLRTLSGERLLGILVDQNVSRKEGLFVDFLGTPACTNKGPALLALKKGAAVLPVFSFRQGRRHRVVVGEQFALPDTGDRDRDILILTESITDAVAEAVRKAPEQWFWVHRRWKTREN